MGSPHGSWEIVFRSDARKPCQENALVLESAGIRFAIGRDDGDYVLLVANSDAATARNELAAYARENAPRPTRSDPFPAHTGAWIGVYAYVALLFIADIFKTRGAFGLAWFDLGKTRADLIRQGEWWRAVTALTLHADASHLIGNMIVGGLFGWFAAELIGVGLAWLSIVLAGAAGNWSTPRSGHRPPSLPRWGSSPHTPGRDGGNAIHQGDGAGPPSSVQSCCSATSVRAASEPMSVPTCPASAAVWCWERFTASWAIAWHHSRTNNSDSESVPSP